MSNNSKITNVNDNDDYFGNSVPSSTNNKGMKKNGLTKLASNLFSTLSELNINDNSKKNSNENDENDENDYQEDDHYKDFFFRSVSQENITNYNDNNVNDSNSNSNSNNNIVLVNQKNNLQPKQDDQKQKKSKKKKEKNIINYDRQNLEDTLHRLQGNSNYCGDEFSKLLLSVNSICSNITKLSNDNMENYSSIIDKTTFESVKCAESMKMLINNMELLNADMFEIYKLYNQIKNVKKGVDQLEILMKTLTNQ